MAITEARAFEIQVARGLTVEIGTDGWLCRLASGVRVRTAPKATPLEALEAAEAHLVAREAEAVERAAARVLQDLQRGDIYVRPRTASVVIDGERLERTVFDAVRTTDKSPLAEGLDSVSEAVSAARTATAPSGNGVGETGGVRSR